MGILSWIFVGLIVGMLAGVVMKGGGFGFIGDIIVGMIGGLLGGWVASSFMHIHSAISVINVGASLFAFAGAVLLLFVLGAFWLGERHANVKVNKTSASDARSFSRED
jgi:uncharacterized membrane protein YeaQ/YmgE (transglycosylase-associated protein family)